MVEMIVVIAIITILAGLLVAAIGHLQRAAKSHQTRQVLNNLQGMYADWNAVTRAPFGAWTMPCPMNVTVELNNPGTMNATANDASISNRYGAVVWVMRDLMFNLKSVPNNAAAMAKFPADEIMVLPTTYDGQGGTFPTAFEPLPQWPTGSPYVPGTTASPYALTRVYTIPDLTNNPTVYVYYDCIQANTAVASNQPPNATCWLPAYPTFTGSGTVPSDDTVPIPLDGWGNPIIFVPGGALGTGAVLGGSMGTTSQITPGSGALEAASTSITVRSPDGRPFFASAGPDGDFSQGDDNLYSFEH
jgi:type II secretory pathway pseudopilin PulG